MNGCQRNLFHGPTISYVWFVNKMCRDIASITCYWFIMYTGSSIYGLIFLFCLKRLLWYICCFFIIFIEIHTY